MKPSPLLLTALLAAGCLGDGSPEADRPIEDRPIPFGMGIDVLAEDGFGTLNGRRVALVCNAASVNRVGVPSWELLHRAGNVELTWLYAPEHGLRTDSFGSLGDSVEGSTGLTVKSLYGRGRAPDPAELVELDALVYDLTDVGVRFFTYTSTLYLCLEACREAGVPLVVLDRPCPLGARIGGPLPDGVSSSFVGKLPVPIRYGLTPGELALMIAGELLPGAEVEIVQLTGYNPLGYYDEQAGEPDWCPPSPNLLRFEGALTYPGVGLFEPANLSVGRGTRSPFGMVGAPWLDAGGLVLYWEAHCPGAVYTEVEFTPRRPSDGRYDGEPCRGVEILVTDRRLFDPLLLAVYGYDFLAVRHAGALSVDGVYLRRMVGDDTLNRLVAGGIGVEELIALWGTGADDFAERVEPYRLYPLDR